MHERQMLEWPMNNRPTRKLICLSKYDYSQDGAYFVTICTNDKALMFGKIINDGVHFTPLGQIVWEVVWNILKHRRNVKICHAVVMPLRLLSGSEGVMSM